MSMHLARATAPAALALILALAPCTVGAEPQAESPEARDALDRAAAFMGGARMLASVRTLVVSSENRMQHEGQRVAIPTRTWYAFPLNVRREITVNGRTLAWASAPGGATLFTADGSSALNAATRQSLERSTMRDPVVLLKARLGRGFNAEVTGTESVDGVAADIVRMRQFDNETLMLVARADGRPIEIRYGNGATISSGRVLSVRWSAWKQAGAGLRYPFRATGTADGVAAFEADVVDVEVDTPLAEALFHGEDESASAGAMKVR